MSVKLIFKSVWQNPGNSGHRIARLCRAAGWQIRKRLLPTKRTLRLPNGARFVAYPDCVVSSALIYADWPEYHELQFMRRVFRTGEVVIDVGTNVGHIGLLLSDISGSENIFAFEPTPISFKRLVENWKENGWSPQNLFQAAVGDGTGFIRVPDTARPETKNSVVPKSKALGTVKVPLVSLDECRARWGKRTIGILKIDVEGYEPQVFAGAKKLLCEDRPRILMFESLDGKVNGGIAELLEIAGYRLFQLNDAGHPDFTCAERQNLFAAPKEVALTLH
jgi:FkbM family methyltransferase